MKRMKQIGALLLSTVLVGGLLTGCGQKDAGSSASTTTQTKIGRAHV